MAKVIAVAGKGGVGKTTLCGLLVRYLVEEAREGTVLAVDADPNSNLNEVLGLAVTSTIGDAREIMKKEVPAGMTKDVWFEYKVHEAVIEGKGYDLLVMGRPEGPGCYCAANTMAKRFIETLRDNYPYVVVDNEAGMEHISRLVTQDIDQLFVVSDASPRGVLTAKRILDLILELGLNIRNTSVIINRLEPPDEESLRETARRLGIGSVDTVRNDGAIVKADREGGTVFTVDKESTAVADAYAIFARVLK